MNTPFHQPNLASYVRDGADAKLNKITFSDGTTQSTAGVTENTDASFNTLSVDKIKISHH